MTNWRQHFFTGLAVLVVVSSVPLLVAAQDSVTVLAGAELTRVVPPGFYFQGLSAPTQMRNAAAARFGDNRYVVAGLVVFFFLSVAPAPASCRSELQPAWLY